MFVLVKDTKAYLGYKYRFLPFSLYWDKKLIQVKNQCYQLLIKFQGCPRFGQRDAMLGWFQRTWGDCQKYADVIASRWRVAEPSNSRSTLATARRSDKVSSCYKLGRFRKLYLWDLILAVTRKWLLVLSFSGLMLN